MNATRRQMALLLPALAAAQTPEPGVKQPSKVFRFEDLPVRKSGPGESRQVFKGDTHTGYQIDMHITDLPAREAPHPPHHHAHEEMVLMVEGQLDVTISGQTTRIGPGGSAYVASNEEHGWRNAGDGRARYYVFAFGRDS